MLLLCLNEQKLKHCKMPPKENKNIKKSIKLAVIGNLRSGKTTSTGHLVSKFSGIDESVIENLVLQSRNMKNGNVWVLNQLKALRNKKNSIDENVFEFETPKYDVLINDTKGHIDFVRNTITGLCNIQMRMILFVFLLELLNSLFLYELAKLLPIAK